MHPIRLIGRAVKRSKRHPSMVYPHVQYEGPAYPDLVHSAEGPAYPDLVHSAIPTSPRELDSRTSDGIHVRLLWHSDSGRVSVAVHDTKTGELFDLPVHDQERALDVYRHPFAYMAA